MFSVTFTEFTDSFPKLFECEKIKMDHQINDTHINPEDKHINPKDIKAGGNSSGLELSRKLHGRRGY